MIEPVLRELRALGFDPTSEELSDIVWLATKLPPRLVVEPIVKPAPPPVVNPVLPSILPVEPAPPPVPGPLPPIEPAPPAPRPLEGQLDVVLPSIGQTRPDGLPFRAPGATALPGAAEIARALRPLQRRVPSRRQRRLDEEATARLVLEENIWLPVMRPVPARWLEVALVVDGAASMALWYRAVMEFRTLLERQGAFRDVRLWTLETEGRSLWPAMFSGARPGPAAIPHDPRELTDPTGRRLIFFVSDGVASAFHDGRLARVLATWGACSPTVLLDALPESLWPGTGVGNAPAVSLRAPARGAPNVTLVPKPLQGQVRRRLTGLPVPLATLEAASLGNLARFVAGEPDLRQRGILMRMRAPPEPDPRPAAMALEAFSGPPPLDGAARVRRFDGSASPLAQRLVRLLSAAPLSLPVIRLIQETMLPESTQAHLAEVFLGGLIEELVQAEPPQPQRRPDEIEYDFREGVRDELLRALPISESLAVLLRVSRFVQDRVGQAIDFAALLREPASSTEWANHPTARPFARVAATVLESLGSEYRELAGRLTGSSGKRVESATWQFNGHWVQVVGTGRDELSKEERLASVAIGAALARGGYGLVTGGWPGVDTVVAEAYAQTRQQLTSPNEVPPLDIVEIASENESHVRRTGNFIEVDPRSAVDVALSRVSGLILIGGLGGTYEAYGRAVALRKPVFPLSATGGDAAGAHGELVAAARSEEQTAALRELARPCSTEQDAAALAEGVAAQLATRLGGRARPTLVAFGSQVVLQGYFWRNEKTWWVALRDTAEANLQALEHFCRQFDQLPLAERSVVVASEGEGRVINRSPRIERLTDGGILVSVEVLPALERSAAYDLSLDLQTNPPRVPLSQSEALSTGLERLQELLTIELTRIIGREAGDSDPLSAGMVPWFRERVQTQGAAGFDELLRLAVARLASMPAYYRQDEAAGPTALQCVDRVLSVSVARADLDTPALAATFLLDVRDVGPWSETIHLSLPEEELERHGFGRAKSVPAPDAKPPAKETAPILLEVRTFGFGPARELEFELPSRDLRLRQSLTKEVAAQLTDFSNWQRIPSTPSAETLLKLGRELWMGLVPPELRLLLQSELETCRERGLFIFTSEPDLPWEILVPHWAKDEPLGALMPMGVWASSIPVPMKLEVRPSKAYFLALSPQHTEEIHSSAGVVQQRGVEVDVVAGVTTQEPVLRALEQGMNDIIHFSGGVVISGDMGEPRLLIGTDKVVSTEVMNRPSIQENIRKRGPLVFLNMSTADDWAAAFCRAGASVVVHARLPISERAAAYFERFFYSALSSGASVGEAMFAARQVVRREFPSDGSWLAYRLCTSPAARVVFPSTAVVGGTADEATGEKPEDALIPVIVRRPQGWNSYYVGYPIAEDLVVIPDQLVPEPDFESDFRIPYKGKDVPACVVLRDSSTDCALLQLDGVTPDWKPLRLAPNPLGHADSKTSIATEYFLTARGGAQPRRLRYESGDGARLWFMLDENEKVELEGLSGAPILRDGEVVGLVNSRSPSGTEPGRSALVGATSSAAVLALIEAFRTTERAVARLLGAFEAAGPQMLQDDEQALELDVELTLNGFAVSGFSGARVKRLYENGSLGGRVLALASLRSNPIYEVFSLVLKSLQSEVSDFEQRQALLTAERMQPALDESQRTELRFACEAILRISRPSPLSRRHNLITRLLASFEPPKRASSEFSPAAQNSTVNAILSSAAVPGRPPIWVVGTFDRPITEYLQQVRALNLVYALSEGGHLTRDSRVAVIGGGVTGVTAAAAAARRGARVTLYEQQRELLSRLRGADNRWLTPHLTRWPFAGWEQQDAGLPLLNWQARPANEVGSVLENAFRSEMKLYSKTRLNIRTSVSSIAYAESGQRVAIQTEAGSSRYDLVILALGGGRATRPANIHSGVSFDYWSDTPTPSALFSRVETYLVSGTGESALEEVFALKLRGFRLDQFAEAVATEEPDLIEALSRIEPRMIEALSYTEVDRLPVDRLMQPYLDLRQTEWLDDWLRSGARKEVDILVQGLNATPLSSKQSALHRFLFWKLISLGLITYVHGVLQNIERSEDRFTVTLREQPSGRGRTHSFDNVVLRHGSSNPIRQSFPDIWKALEQRKRPAMPTTPAWPDGFWSERDAVLP